MGSIWLRSSVVALCALALATPSAWAEEASPAAPLGAWEQATPSLQPPPGAVVSPRAFRAPADDAAPLEQAPVGEAALRAEEAPAQRRILRSWFTPCASAPVRRCTPCCGSPWSIGLYATSAVFEDPTGILGEPVPAGVTPFAFSRNEYDPVGGARLRVVHRRDCEDAFEFRATWYGKTTADSRQTGQYASSNPAGLSPVATATVSNESVVWGFDIGYWRTLSRRGRWETRVGAGWRYLRIDEEAAVKDWVGLPRSFLEAEADNSLFAAQLMAGATFRAARRLELMGDVKLMGGLMVNDVEIAENSILSGGAKNASDDNSEFAWGVEVTLEARYRITRTLWIRGGAEVLYVDGVQGATDSMDFSQAASGAVQPRFETSDRIISTLFLGFDLDL